MMFRSLDDFSDKLARQSRHSCALLRGATAEVRLEIMRDLRIGTFGMLALVLVVLLQTELIVALYRGWASVAALMAAALLVRAMLVVPLAILAPPLADDHADAIAEVAGRFAAIEPDIIVHSDLLRTRQLADGFAEVWNCSLHADERLRELDFGSWELRPWDQIYAETGSEMDRIVSEPNRFAPGGGETLFALRDRVLDWLAGLEGRRSVVAVSHGGPISVLWGVLGKRSVREWPALVPSYGEALLIRREASPA